MSFINTYKKSDEYVIHHTDDPDLKVIKVPLPKAPPLKQIDGYGKKAHDQMFKREPMPPKLIELQNDDFFETLKQVYDFLQQNQKEYKKEIEYIQRQWDRRLNGYWFFNDGKPTYITGCHFYYLYWWNVPGGRPQYRGRDRRWFATVEHYENDPITLGLIYPKHRREGATTRTSCWMLEGQSREGGVIGGIQSMTEEHAKKVFQEHIVRNWRKMPFFFQPIHEGTTNPKEELRFDAPAKRSGSKSKRVIIEKVLESSIGFQPANKGAYDSYRLKRYYADEIGKSDNVDVSERHFVVRECLVEGARKVGFAMNTSTVGEMEKGGGENFKKLADKSYDHERNENGRTISGLITFFMPAYDGLPMFIDQYGESVIDKPTPSQKKYLDKQWKDTGLEFPNIGANEYIQRERDGYLAVDDIEGLNEYIRKYPIKYRECYRGNASDCHFNINILEKRIEHYIRGNKDRIPGDFEWIDGFGSKVRWVPHSEGKFSVSNVLDPKQANKFIVDGDMVYPDNTRSFIAGADPFKFVITNSGKKSQGGGATFMKRDFKIDPEGKDINEWKSYRFCCTYLHRPRTKPEYAEDMLKMCIYYGCEMNCEINVPYVWDYFKENGFSGYLYYKVDRKSHKHAKLPGTNTGESSREEIYQWFYDYIQKHGHREIHDDILTQCKEIQDKMTDYDLFVAAGMAGIANHNTSFFKLDEDEDEGLQIGDYFRGYD